MHEEKKILMTINPAYLSLHVQSPNNLQRKQIVSNNKYIEEQRPSRSQRNKDSKVKRGELGGGERLVVG